MIATILVEGRSCIIQLVERKGLKVVGTGWCGSTANVADGVIQLPDEAYLRCCAKCRAAIETWKRTKL